MLYTQKDVTNFINNVTYYEGRAERGQGGKEPPNLLYWHLSFARGSPSDFHLDCTVPVAAVFTT